MTKAKGEMMYKQKLLIHLLVILSISIFSTSAFANETDPRDRNYYEKRGDIIWEKPTKQKVIALTFDDGPNPKITPKILNLLKQYDAKATFFCIGYKVEKHPKIAKQLVLNGNEIANHTFNHKNIQKLSPSELKKEIDQAQQAIYQATGIQASLFRSPGGAYNERIVKVSKQTHHKMIMWSWDQDTRDWTRPKVQKIIDKVVKNASNGDIVLFHDSQMRTVKALEKILPKLKKDGYRFVTVSELLSLR